MTTYWCELAWLGDPDGKVEHDVEISVERDRITALSVGASPPPGIHRLAGLTVPGMANAHSHAFHRALRGRTHGESGSFWTWRERMYALADRLDPASYRGLATATFAEMVLAGFTCVGEFHYLHHDRGGTPYARAERDGPCAARRCCRRWHPHHVARHLLPPRRSGRRLRAQPDATAVQRRRRRRLGAPSRLPGCRSHVQDRRGHPFRSQRRRCLDAGGRRLVRGAKRPAARSPQRTAGRERAMRRGPRLHPHRTVRRLRRAERPIHRGPRDAPERQRHRPAAVERTRRVASARRPNATWPTASGRRAGSAEPASRWPSAATLTR